MRYVYFFLTWMIALVLLISSINHISNIFLFFISFLRYEIFSGNLAAFLVVTLLACQIVLATMLIANVHPRFSLLGAAVLFGVFVIAQVSAVIRELNISCGCFGSLDEPIGWLTVGRTIFLFCCCVLAMDLLKFFDKTEPELT